MAALALQDPDEAVRELERCVVESPDNLVYLDDARMTPFWEALTALDVPLYLHPRASHKAAMYDNHPELTGANWGFAPETATHALRIVYGGIFDRFPTARGRRIHRYGGDQRERPSQDRLRQRPRLRPTD
jgi:2,3-dihydroxybenzoate decarboxylase